MNRDILNSEKIEIILKKMYDLTFHVYRYCEKGIESVPIVCIAFDDDFNIISAKRNSCSNSEKKKNLSHAEYHIKTDIKWQKKTASKYNYIVSTYPCNACLQMMFDLDVYKFIIVQPKEFDPKIAKKYNKIEFIHLKKYINSNENIDFYIENLNKRIKTTFKKDY